QAEPLTTALSDNRLQPVSAIAPPVTNIKQLLQPEKEQRYRQKERDRCACTPSTLKWTRYSCALNLIR
ncbi:hypothetical protein ABVT39_009381, partial [Epinephelus coioides]